MSKKKAKAKGGTASAPALDRGTFASRFVRGVLLWLVPVVLAWLVATPFYNRFLTEAAENLVKLSESPNVTRLSVTQKHYFMIFRSDYPAAGGQVTSVRVTDTHFPLVMLGAFFLAVPGVGWRKRLEALGWAVLLSVFFHLLSLFFWVKFVYATQLGEWSAARYGVFAQNFWGLGKHLLDLPFKFAFPLILWAFFYLRLLLPSARE